VDGTTITADEDGVISAAGGGGSLEDSDMSPSVPSLKPITIFMSADGFSLTVADSGLPAIHGDYEARGVQNGQWYYNLIGQSDNPHRNAVSWDGSNWTIYTDNNGEIAFTSDNNELGFLMLTGLSLAAVLACFQFRLLRRAERRFGKCRH
jgi:hypothetical protein